MLLCVNCAAEVTRTQKFCSDCGQSLAYITEQDRKIDELQEKVTALEKQVAAHGRERHCGVCSGCGQCGRWRWHEWPKPYTITVKSDPAMPRDHWYLKSNSAGSSLHVSSHAKGILGETFYGLG